jgi:hypothetical protein
VRRLHSKQLIYLSRGVRYNFEVADVALVALGK